MNKSSDNDELIAWFKQNEWIRDIEPNEWHYAQIPSKWLENNITFVEVLLHNCEGGPISFASLARPLKAEPNDTGKIGRAHV